jgi:hypothetical protein
MPRVNPPKNTDIEGRIKKHAQTGAVTQITFNVWGDLALRMIDFQNRFGGGAAIQDVCRELLTLALDSPITTNDLTTSARVLAFNETRRWAFERLKESMGGIEAELTSVIQASKEAEAAARRNPKGEPR